MSINPVHNNLVFLSGSDNAQSIDNGKVTSFSQIFAEACNEEMTVQDMFQSAFPGNNLQTKVGNCNVSWECWDRNDFPVWEYFKKNTTAECLNNWRPTRPDPPQSDSGVQRGLSQIDYGEIVILMPAKLQAKMESDSEFAEEVLKKVQKWKEDYDKEDNAIAASLGYDPELNQISKSYCIQLDEDGNVGDHTVVGGGLDDKHSEKEIVIISTDDDKPMIIKKTGKKPIISMVDTAAEIEQINFESIAPNLMPFPRKI